MDNKRTITFKIKSLLYNNDVEAIEYLKRLKLYNKYSQYDRVVESKVVNTIKMDFYTEDMIDYIKKIFTLHLFDKIKKENNKDKNTCFYCFAHKGNGKDNEIIKINQKEEKEDDFGDIDEFDEDLADILGDDDEESDIESVDISDMTGGARDKNKDLDMETNRKIMVCHNCCKIYLFNKYYNDQLEYDDIFPIPELITFFHNDNMIGHNYIDNMRKPVELSLKNIDIRFPYDNITEIQRDLLIKRNPSTLLEKILGLIKSVDSKYYRYLKNESFFLLDNFAIEDNTLTVAYFPEMALYNKTREYKAFDLYSKIHFPYVDFYNYYLKFIEKNMNAKISYSLAITNKAINRDPEKYSVTELLFGWEDNKKAGWGEIYKNYERVLTEFKKMKIEKSKIEEYTNKIFYKINDNANTSILVDFQKVYHLFEMNEDYPYLVSYIADESVILEKIYRKELEQIKQYGWELNNKNVINFRILLPDNILPDNEKHYFQFNLYENLKMEVNISIPSEFEQYVTKEKLLSINKKVNDLIKILNNLSIFTFPDISLPLSNTDFKDWNNDKDQTTSTIYSMNCYLKLKSKLDETSVMKTLQDIHRCMNIYYHKDYDIISNTFRYKRINNITSSNITDKFIYYSRQEAMRERNITDPNMLKKIIIADLMNEFDKHYEEAYSLYENYVTRYKTFQIKPMTFGLYFNIKKPDEWKDVESEYHNYKVTVMGMRGYDNWAEIKTFISKLFYFLSSVFENDNDKATASLKKICDIENTNLKISKPILKKTDYTRDRQEFMQCDNVEKTHQDDIDNNKKELRNIRDEIKKLKKEMKKSSSSEKQRIGKDIKNYETRMKEIDNENKNLEKDKLLYIKRKRTLKTKIEKQKEKLKKHDSVVPYLRRLQSVYSNLAFQCYECGFGSMKQECERCKNKISQRNYSSTCQRTKQPMGTSTEGNNPKIIDFDKDYEIRRLNDFKNVTCNIKKTQKGGSKPTPVKIFTKKIYENWGLIHKPKVYKTKLSLKNCLNGPKDSKQGYSLVDIKKVAKEYDIETRNYSKAKICKMIIKKVVNKKKIVNQVGGTQQVGGTKEDLETIEKLYKMETIDNNKKLLNVLRQFHRRAEMQDLLRKSSQETMAQLFGFKHKFDEKYTCKKISRCIFNAKKYLKYKNKIIKLFKLESFVDAVKNSNIKDKQKFIMGVICYIFLTMSSKWDKKSIEMAHELFEYEPSSKMLNVRNRLRNNLLSSKQLISQYGGDVNKREDDMSFDDFTKKVGMLYNTDKNGNLTQTTMAYKNKAISCPNFNNETNEKMVGFLSFGNFENKRNLKDAEIRDMVCKPCCFVPGKNEEEKYDESQVPKIQVKGDLIRRTLFCKGNISWKRYNELENDSKKIENYIYSTNAVNKYKTYGRLTNSLDVLFNNYHNLYNLRNKKDTKKILFSNYKNNLLKSIGFVLKGVKQSNKVIVDIVSDILGVSETTLINAIGTILKSNEMLFKSLNQGKIAIKFKTYQAYLTYLKGDVVEPEWFIDAVSLPNLFKGFKNGINIITFKLMENDIKIKDFSYPNYYDEQKTNIYLYEYPNGALEPIILKQAGDNSPQIQSFAPNDKYTTIKAKFKDVKVILNDLTVFIGQWVTTTFKSSFKTNIDMIKMLAKDDIKVSTQIIDNFYKSLFVVIKKGGKDIMIPVIPGQIDIKTKTKQIITKSDLDMYMMSLDDTITYINTFAKSIRDPNYEFAKIVLNEKKTSIVGIELINKLLIPVKDLKYEKSKHKGYIKSRMHLYFKINNALYAKKIPKTDIDFIKESYDYEVYQRILLEIATYFMINTVQRDNIKNLVQEDTYDNRQKLKDNLTEIMSNVVTYKEPETVNYRAFDKYSKDSNIRKTCNNSNNDIMCRSNKLVVPYDKKNRFLGILIENLLTNKEMRNKIFTNTINRIINTKNFLDTKNHVFIKKESSF